MNCTRLFSVLQQAGLFLSIALLAISCSQPAYEPSGYVLIYGVADYPPQAPYMTKNPDLELVAHDAHEVAELFRSQGYEVDIRNSGSPENSLLPLLDATAQLPTKAQLIEDFAAAKEKAGRNGTFIFYYAGHGGQYGSGPEPSPQTGKAFPYGDQLPGSGYEYQNEVLIMFPDSGWSSITDYYLTDDELAELLASVNASKKVVILDSCRSGGFIGNQEAYDPIPQDYRNDTSWPDDAFSGILDHYSEYVSLKDADVRQSEVIVMTAAGEQEDSYDTYNLGNGVFTYYFLEAALKGDRDMDGYISATEVYEYSAAGVKEYSESHPLDMLPYLPRISGNTVDFILFRTPEP